MMEPPKMDLIQNNNDGSIDSPSSVELSKLTEAITLNYNKYHLIEQQLKSIQEWILEQEKLHNGSVRN